MSSPTKFWRPLLLLTTLYTLPFGLLFLFVPAWGLGLLGLQTNDVGLLIARYFAAIALGTSGLSGGLYLRALGPDETASMSLLLAFGATLCVSLYAVSQGLLSTLIGLVVLGFDLLFTVGYGYFALRKVRTASVR